MNTTISPFVARVGNYELLEHLSTGAQGAVHKARDIRTDRIVALKVVRDGRLAAPMARARFAAEASLAERLCHPNICQAIETATDPECEQYIAFEFVHGQTLDAWSATREAANGLGRNELLGVRLAIFCGTCSAVQFANSMGILHRDIKPTNVIIESESNRPVLIDFGLQKPTHSLQNFSHGFVGTYSFAAPEQVASRIYDQRSEVYGMGILLYFLMSNRHPLQDLSDAEIARHREGNEKLGSIRSHVRTVPEPLARVISKALSPDPDNRYETVASLLEDVVSFRNGQPVSAPKFSPIESGKRMLTRNRLVRKLPTILVLVSLFTLLWILRASSGSSLDSTMGVPLMRDAISAFDRGEMKEFAHNGSRSRQIATLLIQSNAIGDIETGIDITKRIYEACRLNLGDTHVRQLVANDPPIPTIGSALQHSIKQFDRGFSVNQKGLMQSIVTEMEKLQDLPYGDIEAAYREAYFRWSSNPEFLNIENYLPYFVPATKSLAELARMRSEMQAMALSG